jgi:hypothetical protein
MTPQKFVPSPNKPGIQIDDKEKLNTHFDIQLSTSINDNTCSTTTAELFHNHMSSQQKKVSLKKQENAFYIVNQIVDFKQQDIFDDTVSITKDFKNNKFIKFIKHAVIHYCEILERVKPFPKNDERTFFVEGIQTFVYYI